MQVEEEMECLRDRLADIMYWRTARSLRSRGVGRGGKRSKEPGALPASIKGAAKRLLCSRCGQRECATVLVPAESRAAASYLREFEGYPRNHVPVLCDPCLVEVMQEYSDLVEPVVEPWRLAHRN